MIRRAGICSSCGKWKKVLVEDRINPIRKLCEECLSKQYYLREEQNGRNKKRFIWN